MGNFEFSKWNKYVLNLLCLLAIDQLCQNSSAHLELNLVGFFFFLKEALANITMLQKMSETVGADKTVARRAWN